MRSSVCFVLMLFFLGVAFHCGHHTAYGQSQATAADLVGAIRDESGAVLANIDVTLTNPQTNFTRKTTTNEDGSYKFLAVPPSNYVVTVDAPGFKQQSINLELVLGTTGILNFSMRVESSTNIIDIQASSDTVDTTRSAVAQTVDQDRIDNLPINGRNFLGFAFINSLVGRDTTPPLGPAPTSGLNFSGQRARSNLVQVDGADNTDNGSRGARSTISQEAVQEFQVVINSFAAEFGRTAGGLVNIVTKSGTNSYHGNAFGFIRHRSIQARNGLAFQPAGADPKPAFTRGQYGFTFGGPIKKDKTFFFLSLDQTRRHESGFSEIGIDTSIFDLTDAQKAFIASSPIGRTYEMLARSGAQVARTGVDPITGQAVFLPTSLLSQGKLGAIQPSFRPLSNIQNVYPIREEFTFYSAKIDQQINNNNRLNVRYTFTPITTTGQQSSGQNQPFGLNDLSRTGISIFRDTSVVVQDTHILGQNKVNEFLFSFGRRSALFTSSDNVAINIPGAGFFGREPFSPASRVEKVYELKDNFTISKGTHTTKFGTDISFIRLLPTSFELNFSGVFNFGDLPASTFNALDPAFANAPSFTTVQAYGLGFPQTFIQGFGNPKTRVKNTALGFYGQDSWKIKPNFTLNYGVRYDVELTPKYPALPIQSDRLNLSADQVAAAEKFLNVTQGIPRDKNNIAPRVAFAWDPKGNGRTVIRAAYGLFYDHPLLFVAINSDIADGVQSSQLIAPRGNPLPASALNATQIFQGTVVVGTTPGIDQGSVFLPAQSRFNARAVFPGFGVLLPFSLPVDRDFQYAYTNQVNLTIEHEISNNTAISASYIFTGGRKLPHSVNRNAPDGKRVLTATPMEQVINNFFRPSGPNPVFVKTALPIPFGTVGVQESTSSSVYHAVSLNFSKRIGQLVQLLASYSYSKTIDDSTDLQSLLQPQDNRNPGLERSLSIFDQRHRFVFSGVFKSPFKAGDGLQGKFLSGFVISPIIEVSSGRPFNILTGTDTNLDQSSVTDRPNFNAATGQLLLPALGTTGALGRNPGVSPGFASVDLRISRKVSFGERVRMEFIAEAFNLFNRVNIATVNNNFRLVRFEEGKFKSPATSLFDPRQLQFGIKIDF